MKITLAPMSMVNTYLTVATIFIAIIVSLMLQEVWGEKKAPLNEGATSPWCLEKCEIFHARAKGLFS